jgi:MFS-type transporter involved in bile tolerance (Atg22 family)
LIIALAVFFAVGVLHISMTPVVIIAIPASLAAAWFTDKDARHG